MCLPVSKAVNANVMDLRVISRFSWAIAQGRRAASTPFGVCYTLPILCAVGVTVHVPNYWKGGGGFVTRSVDHCPRLLEILLRDGC